MNLEKKTFSLKLTMWAENGEKKEEEEEEVDLEVEEFTLKDA